MYYPDIRTDWLYRPILKPSEVKLSLSSPPLLVCEDVFLRVDELDDHTETFTIPERVWDLFSIKIIDLNDNKGKKLGFLVMAWERFSLTSNLDSQPLYF